MNNDDSFERDFEHEFNPIKILPHLEDPNKSHASKLNFNKFSKAKDKSSSDVGDKFKSTPLVTSSKNTVQPSQATNNDGKIKKQKTKAKKKFEKLAHLKLVNHYSDNHLLDDSSSSDVEKSAPNPKLLINDGSVKNRDSVDFDSNDPEFINNANSSLNKTDPIFKPSEGDIELLKRQVLSQLNGNFVNLEKTTLNKTYQDVYSLIEKTVRDKESHSLLVIGPRSSGKTSIINRVMKELNAKHKEDFLYIYLNSIVHSDDSSAMREIARQLDIKLSQEKDSSKKKNERFRSSSTIFERKSMNDTFSNILKALNKTDGKQERLPLIFVIDEFDRYAHNSRQMLLYNLLDFSQDSLAPTSVIGLTSKITTRESLEKRVSSRFSQRIVLINHDSNLEQFWNNLKSNLKISIAIAELTDKSLQDNWNQHIENLYEQQDSKLKKVVMQNFYSVKNIGMINNFFKFMVTKLSTELPLLDSRVCDQYNESFHSNRLQNLIASFSDTEMLLVIASARWLKKFDSSSINFNLAYGEYKDMLHQHNINSSGSSTFERNIVNSLKIHQKIWSQKVLLHSWETLYKLGILMDQLNNNTEGNSSITSNASKNFIIEENKMVLLDLTLDELNFNIKEQSVYRKYMRL